MPIGPTSHAETPELRYAKSRAKRAMLGQTGAILFHLIRVH